MSAEKNESWKPESAHDRKESMIMSKNLGVKPYLFPMPTYMIGIYNENNTVDVMMMGWGKFAPKIWLR